MKIMILAMGRTGHHAVLQWIVNGLEGCVFVNHNCGLVMKNGKFTPHKVTVQGDIDFKIRHSIYTIEDFHLPLWNKIKGIEKFDKVISVVRSPRNWLASSIACKGWANDYLDVAPENEPVLPVSRIKAYTKYLEDWLNGFVVETSINYDQLITNPQYRQLYVNELGIKCTDVPEQCKFSSFKKPYDHTEDRSKLLNKKQKRRFNRLYNDYLKSMQEKWWGL